MPMNKKIGSYLNPAALFMSSAKADTIEDYSFNMFVVGDIEEQVEIIQPWELEEIVTDVLLETVDPINAPSMTEEPDDGITYVTEDFFFPMGDGSKVKLNRNGKVSRNL